MNTLSLDIRILRTLQSVSETGNVTESARRLGRTQPAITLQLQRLESICGFNLFRSEGRKMTLTPDGALVLSYANSILRLHDEMLSRLQAPDVEGHVVLGTPDLYAAFMLPSILALFRQSFPRVQVQLQCSLSTPLVRSVHRGEVDLALVTRMNDFSGGKVVFRNLFLFRHNLHKFHNHPNTLLDNHRFDNLLQHVHIQRDHHPHIQGKGDELHHPQQETVVYNQ